MKRLEHPPWPLDERTPASAALVLPALAESFFANGDKVARMDSSEVKLHAFRLNAKEFRYTLESFRPLYGPAMDRYIANVRKIQTVLGDLNDCRATGDLLGQFDVVAAVEVEQLRLFLEARKEQLRAKFLASWGDLFSERRRISQVRYLMTRVAVGESAEL